MQVFTYFLNNSKTLGTVSVTVNEVSKSRRTGSWASITYMNIWAQQQVLRVSVLEKKRQKLWLHWQAQVQWDSNLKTWFGATKEDDVDLWPPRAHTPPPPPPHPPTPHTQEHVQTQVHTHQATAHFKQDQNLSESVVPALQLQLVFPTIICVDCFAKIVLIRFICFRFCSHYAFLHLLLSSDAFPSAWNALK